MLLITYSVRCRCVRFSSAQVGYGMTCVVYWPVSSYSMYVANVAISYMQQNVTDSRYMLQFVRFSADVFA